MIRRSGLVWECKNTGGLRPEGVNYQTWLSSTKNAEGTKKTNRDEKLIDVLKERNEKGERSRVGYKRSSGGWT